jgi:hypothetical protein
MVWGCIWKGGRSPLVIMIRDDESPRKGYLVESYIWALEEGLAPFYRPGTFFFRIIPGCALRRRRRSS